LLSFSLVLYFRCEDPVLGPLVSTLHSAPAHNSGHTTRPSPHLYAAAGEALENNDTMGGNMKK
jgi:hypothetical protein